MQNLPLRLLEVPLSQLVERDEGIGGVDIELGEEEEQPAGDIELVLVIDEVLSVHEVLPLGLGLVSGGRVVVVVGGGSFELGVGVVDVLLLPFFVFAVALELGDEGVEGDGVVAGGGECEVGAEFEAAVTVVAFGGEGEEQENDECNGDVNEYGGSAH